MFYEVACLIFLLPFVYRLLSFYSFVVKSRDLPPGPFPLPFIGNLHLIGSAVHLSLRDLANKYGDLMTVYFGTDRAVIVSSPDLAREVLVRQSYVFGGRPTNLPFGAVVLSHNGRNIAFREKMTAKWKKQRKVFHAAMKSFGSGLLLLEDKICDVLEDLIGLLGEHQGTARNIKHDIHLCVSNMICAVTFGSKYKETDEEFKLILNAFEVITRSVAPGNLVDVFPLLRKLPIKQVQSIRDAAQLVESIVAQKYREHQRKLDDDNIRDLIDALLKLQRSCADEDTNSDVELTEEEVKLIIVDGFVAGIETNAASILWGIYYLARNPELQDTIHNEMQRFLQPDVPPTFSDRNRLPFLRATITEMFRCSSVTPLLLPHRTVTDAYVNDYVIPEGTTVMINAWAIHHDPRIWDDPHTFRPARFIDRNENYLSPAPFSYLPFSAGKRVCVGEVLGKMIVFVSLARMLHAYRFSLASDESLGTDDAKKESILTPKKFYVVVEKRE